jgi:hypothetical protein
VPLKGTNLFAAFALKLPQAFLRISTTFSRGGAQQDSRLIAISSYALSMPVQFRERQFRAGIAFLHGHPEQSDRFRGIRASVLAVQKL